MPAETDPPLVVDPDAVLVRACALQLLESIAGWNSQVVQLLRCIENQELPIRTVLHLGRQLSTSLPIPHTFRVGIPEALDHVWLNSNALR